MKKSLLLALFLFVITVSFGQSITMLWTGVGSTDDWNNSSNWVQLNAPVGQTPIQRVPTELDHVIFSQSQSGLASVFVKFPQWDSLIVGGNGTTGSRCKSMRISQTTLQMTDQSGDYSFKINIHTSNGGKVLIDSASDVQWGHFYLHGGNPAINDLEILNSSFGILFSHNNWSNVYIHPNGKARFVNSILEGYQFGAINFGSTTSGGELFAENSSFATISFEFGQNSHVTLINTEIFNDQNNPSLNFFIGKNSTFISSNANVTSWANLTFYTSGSTLRGNVTLQQENGGGSSSGFRFLQEDPLNPLPNIIDGNLTIQGGQGTLGIMGDVKISGNFVNNATETLISPDTSNVFVNGQRIFKIGGITNYRNNVFIDNCVQNLCHFKFELFGSGSTTLKWPVGIPLDTMIVNKSGCGKVFVDNSLYVSGQLRVQSGQLVLNPNDGITYKMVTAGDVIVNSGAGIFLRRNSAGVPANIAIGGTLVNSNATSDSSCVGISNPYNGTILLYNPNVNNITVPVCVNSGTSIVSNVSGNTYRWERNTGSGYSPISNGITFSGVTTATLQLITIPSSWDTYLFRCIVNGTLPSHTFILDVVPSLPASVTITASSTSFCPSNPIIFSAHPVNGGPTPIYQWQVNGVNAGTNFYMFTPSTLNDNDVVKILMQSSLSCATPDSSTSNSIAVTVPLVVPSVTISSSATTVCSGSPVTFTALPVNGGPTPMYQWRLNGVPVASGPVYTIGLVTAASMVKVIMTSSHLCAVPATATSNEITVTVSSAGVTPSVSITASATTICSNANVVFTATPVNGGAQPSYQWQVDGMHAGTNSPTFSTSALANGSNVKVVMISSSPCASPATATSNSISVTVGNNSIPSVSVIASSTSICPNETVTFTATPVNGGANPVYEWKKNGVAVGSNNPVFVASNLASGDQIQVVMISNALCISATQAVSNTISIIVTGIVPTIVINGETVVSQGTNVVISSNVTNGGNAPSYQWQDSTELHAWQTIANEVHPVLNYTPLSTGDRIRAILTSSAACANPSVVPSNVLAFTVARPSMTTDRVAAYPNPARSYLIVDSLSTTDQWSTLTVLSSGGRIHFSRNISGQNKITVSVQSLLPGMYMIRLSRNVGYPLYKKFIKL